jgi:hypothetical protein
MLDLQRSHVPFPFAQFGYSTIGITISIILPILRKKLPQPLSLAKYFPTGETSGAVRVYLYIGLFSLLTSVIILAFGGAQVASWEWYTATIYGFTWDSILQKIGHG